MHHINKTDSLVLNSQNLRESDKQLILLTKDFGLLKIIAQGVRKIESKLRPSIQDYSFCQIAFVSGRAGFRLTNARIEKTLLLEIKNQKILQSILRSLNLIERLVWSEINDGLYDLVYDFCNFIIKNQNRILHQQQIHTIESLFVLNILNKLGYVDNQKYGEYLNQKISLELINDFSDTDRKNLNKVINQSIKESGL